MIFTLDLGVQEDETGRKQDKVNIIRHTTKMKFQIMKSFLLVFIEGDEFVSRYS